MDSGKRLLIPRRIFPPGEFLGAALGDRGGRYVHVSSVSAYDVLPAAGANEDSPLATLDDPNVEEVNDETYGGLRRCVSVRPTTHLVRVVWRGRDSNQALCVRRTSRDPTTTRVDLRGG